MLLSVGRLEPEKGFETLLEAFQLVRKKRIVKLVVLGSGRLRDRLLLLAQKLGISNDVELLGFVSNPYPYMRHASLFVLASKREGFGNVIVEALACGTRVVSTNCPGPVELLEGGKLGRLVPVGDSRALAEAIETDLVAPLASDVDLFCSLAKYAVDASAKSYIDTFELS